MPKTRHLALTAALLVATGLAAPATAVTTFKTTLSQANEVPPTGSPATGSGTFILSDDENSLDVNLSFSGLTAPSVAGHLHCCAPVGANTGVAVPFTFVSGTSGLIVQTFDLTQAATYTAGFVTAYGSVAGARTAFVNGLNDGLVYANIHSALNPGGEIRGQLGAVPEPATWALMIGGFALTGVALRRRGTALAA